MQGPQADGVALETCPAAAQAFCAVDLLADSQSKAPAPVSTRADFQQNTVLPDPNIVEFAPALQALRSSIGDPPLITPLRV
jgi:hypothetical protein